MPRWEDRSVPVASSSIRPGSDLPACFGSDRTILDPAAQCLDLSGSTGRFAVARGQPSEVV